MYYIVKILIKVAVFMLGVDALCWLFGKDISKDKSRWDETPVKISIFQEIKDLEDAKKLASQEPSQKTS